LIFNYLILRYHNKTNIMNMNSLRMNYVNRNIMNTKNHRIMTPKKRTVVRYNSNSSKCKRYTENKSYYGYNQNELNPNRPLSTRMDFKIFKSFNYCVFKTLGHRKYIADASKKMYPVNPTKNDIVNTYPLKSYSKKSVIVTIDSVVIAEGKVLLIKRKKEPYKNKWAFPGGRIETTDKDILSAAVRELREETNLENVELEYFKTIGNSTRDPRGFSVTNIYISQLGKIPDNVKAGDDAMICKWFDISELPSMAFDHKQIMDDINKKLETSDT
jgi:8-oxo-dGTP diphosphatase